MHADAAEHRWNFLAWLKEHRPLPQAIVLVFFLLVCFATAAIGTLWTNAALDDWYPTLAKPSWNPPNWVFGPVWTLLYAAMAVAAWLVWRSGPAAGRPSVWIPFAAQLVLNAAWSGIFFGLRRPGWAFAEVIVLWLAIAVTAVVFWRHSRWAGWLLVPYLAWVAFAAALNFAIWRLNA